jgi:amino acid transporter
MKVIDLLFGRPLASSEDSAEKIGTSKGVSVFGLDALASAAYGPEAALTLLIPLGVAGVAHIIPISIAIIVLLGIVFFSYRQTIAAYPEGGGSYTVAHQNLGIIPGLFAAAALLIDYTLDAAVGISAGVAALTSAFSVLHAHTLGLCLAALLLLAIANLRGVRDNGAVLIAPTYIFLLTMFIVLGIGIAKAISSGGHPHAIIAPPISPATVTAVSAWLLLRSFAGGCTALTGVEAVSNGVQAFRDDSVKNARRTLAIIIAALGIMLAGIAYLVKAYGIMATDPNGKNYQTILSMLLSAVTGRGWFYYFAIISILLVLTFSANTAFADFPRVCNFVAEDGYLPNSLTNRGRRLVYSEAIIVLTVVTGALLIAFRGITNGLIPLFAVGAFLAFTMSQAGMVAHWRREGGKNARRNMFINAVGATATGVTVLIIIVAKFMEGAWITVIAIPSLVALMYGIHRHYKRVQQAIDITKPLEPHKGLDALIVIAMTGWTRVGKQALQFAMTLSDDIKVVHAAEEDKPDELCEHWSEYVQKPAEAAGLPVPELVRLKSPYRFVITPIVDYVVQLANDNPQRRIVTIVPELMERRWYYYFLHTQRATLLKTRLLMLDNDRISVLNIPWSLKKH